MNAERDHLSGMLRAMARRAGSLRRVGPRLTEWLATIDDLSADRDAARAELSAVRDRLDRHRAALADALEGMEEMRPDVPEYFREKYGCDDYIARAKAVLAEDTEGRDVPGSRT